MKKFILSLYPFYKFTRFIVIVFGSLLFYGWVWGLLFGLLTKEFVIPTPWHTFLLLINHNFNSNKINILLFITLLIPIVILILCLIGNYQKKRLAKLFGDAHWASYLEIKKMGLFNKSGLIIGEKYGKLLQAKLTSHALIFAPSRSGKGVSQVMPNALTFKDSLLVI